MKTIELIVSPQGEVKATAKGFAGPSCTQATDFLAKALGQVTADVKTDDFYKTEVAQEHLGEQA